MSQVTVVGAGTAAANGVYTQNGNLAWSKSGPRTVDIDPIVDAAWRITDTVGNPLYNCAYNGENNPPKTGWTVIAGAGPAPTIEY